MKTPTQIAMIAALAATFLAAGGRGGRDAAPGTKPGTTPPSTDVRVVARPTADDRSTLAGNIAGRATDLALASN